MKTKILLWCGEILSVHYVLINVITPFFYKGYSVLDLTVSELSAIGAPTRTLWLAIAWPWFILIAAFGWGVLRSSAHNRFQKVAGWSLIALSVLNAYWPPMHTRAILASGGETVSDTLHLVWAGVTVLLFLLIMGFGAAALEKAFRIYTVTSIMLLAVFGMLTSAGAPNVQANLPTPWIGLWERINTGIFLIWIIVFAASLLRRRSDNLPAQHE